jgi:hypothetical protein
MVAPDPAPASPQGALRRTVRFARMTGTSVAAPSAAGWLTDFLNAAYYARPAEGRDVADLRLAMGIVATRWHRLGRRLALRDLGAFHRAFGRHRLHRHGSGFARLSRDELLYGASRLVGTWFPDAWADDGLRAYGIAFPDAASREAFAPESRLRKGALAAMSPPSVPTGDQVWGTYAPVEVPSASGAAGLLMRPERWPDFASALGQFTPVRADGLLGQTFEIEIVVPTLPRAPILTRGYVTATRLETLDSPDGLASMMSELESGLGAPAIPPGGRAVVACELTTHDGHFIGPARSRLIVWDEPDGRAYIRDVGSWDPMRWPVATSFRHGGRVAQHAFWGEGAPQDSMLHQLARTA